MVWKSSILQQEFKMAGLWFWLIACALSVTVQTHIRYIKTVMTKAVFQTMNFKTHKIKLSEAYHPHWQEDDQKLCPWQRNEPEWHLHSQKPLGLNITAGASHHQQINFVAQNIASSIEGQAPITEYADTKQPHTEIRLIMGAFTWQNNGSCSLILGMSIVSVSIAIRHTRYRAQR